MPGLCVGLRLAPPDKRVRTSSPWVRVASREPRAKAEERSESRLHLLGLNPCNRTFGGLTSAGGVVAEATGAGHMGKITSRVSAPNPESLK